MNIIYNAVKVIFVVSICAPLFLNSAQQSSNIDQKVKDAWYAAYNEKLDVLKALLKDNEVKKSMVSEPLKILPLVAHDCVGVVKELLEAGVPFDSKNMIDQTLFHWVKDPLMFEFLLSKDKERVARREKSLLSVKDKFGITPVAYAMTYNKFIFEQMLFVEPDIDAFHNYDGMEASLLVHAAQTHNTASMDLLLEYGASTKIKGKNESGEDITFDQLVEEDAKNENNNMQDLVDFWQLVREKNSQKFVDWLKEQEEKAQENDKSFFTKSIGAYHRTVLHALVSSGKESLVQAVMDSNLVSIDEWNIQDDRGNTPLHYAYEKGHTNIAKTLSDIVGVDTTIANNDKIVASNMPRFEIKQRTPNQSVSSPQTSTAAPSVDFQHLSTTQSIGTLSSIVTSHRTIGVSCIILCAACGFYCWQSTKKESSNDDNKGITSPLPSYSAQA